MTTLRILCGTLALCALLLAPRTLPAQVGVPMEKFGDSTGKLEYLTGL